MKTAVVIPCYRVAAHIAEVIAGIPPHIDHIVVVDDTCPQASGEVAAKTGEPRLTVVRHEVNQGVGGAMVTGYRKALDLGCDICVKLDGDGQMDPALIDRFVVPLKEGWADYAKGNRFTDFKALRAMPKVRLFGNSVLSFLLKAASGYWSMMDPTNGYTAIHRRALEEIDLDRLSKRYFFESDMLIRLGEVSAPVVGIPMPAKYGDEQSSLSIGKTLVEFPPKILRGFPAPPDHALFRLRFRHGVGLSAARVPLTLFGLIYGAVEWADSVTNDAPKAIGVVMLAAVPFILGFQMLLQAVAIDIANEPKPRDGRRRSGPLV